MSINTFPTESLLAGLADVPVEEDEVKVFEFDGFRVVYSVTSKTWVLEFDADTTEDLDEDMAIVLEDEETKFDEDAQAFLLSDFGVDFTILDMSRLKDHLNNEEGQDDLD